MRIQCCFCGERDVGEFIYLGAAQVERPEPAAAEAASRFYEAVYLRDNPAGSHEELWYHAYGCRSWLRVRRDTLTHEIHEVGFASAALEAHAAESPDPSRQPL